MARVPNARSGGTGGSTIRGASSSSEDSRFPHRQADRYQRSTTNGPPFRGSEASPLEPFFAIPETRSYLIPDVSHARDALAMVAKNGTPEEIARVRAAVKRRFPGFEIDGLGS